MTVAQKAQFLEKPLTRWLEMLGVFGFCRTAAATRPSLSSSVPHLGSKWVELKWSLLASTEHSCSKVLLYLFPSLWTLHMTLWSPERPWFLSSHGPIGKIIHNSIWWFFFKFYFIFKLYIIVLVLPNIKMNPPQVYMWGINFDIKQQVTFQMGDF